MKETIFEQVASAASVLKLDLSAEEFALFAEDREFSEAGMEAVQMLLGYLSEKKQQTTIQTLLKMSRLPTKAPKTFENFDFSLLKGKDVEHLKGLPSLNAIYVHRNLAFIGPAGTGKTHLAVGLALSKPWKPEWWRITLCFHLKKVQLQGNLERRWLVYLRPALLVIDEVGYMQLNRQKAELLFRLISERYEHGSVILTSNKYFSDWGELLSDNVLDTALLDRLLHHSHVMNIRGQTYRLRERMKAGVQLVPPVDLPADD